MPRIASAQYDVSFLETWENFETKTRQWTEEATNNKADILLFPEYACMELASLFPKTVYSSLSGQLDALQTLLPRYLDLFKSLAMMHQVYIQAGTYPVKHGSGEFRNHAYFFTPQGDIDYQEKLTMTRFENEQWHISRGFDIKVFDTAFGKVAINICYDSEFPHYARQQAERGATLILVPSCTDTEAGYYRVRIGCQSRALENQCYVVQASLVGNAEWSEAVDVNCGAAAIYTAVDRGFPNNGILAIGDYNKTQWVYADLDLNAVAQVRKEGQVFNYRDWPRQFDCK
ncbi:MAG: carbon-nitrogen hydrolase family protein [Methylomonas sp.]|nr:carbon-nitrogen hydrolase family protein [Methylomonas sp.]PPD21431.1 MAG: amidohydrolase [Methylomonas sp.]PPD23535.1 MAG: amidohydrolase [Methylomonas sp.]PPD30829.1 MAG: amidohydrolase [Methylomonas sp.]PPD41444.1 MAG: amidohydrolase [Methylomonas sp.]